MLLSRVRDFDDVLLLRLPDRAALSRARPQYLQDAYQEFLAKEKATLAQLDSILRRQNFQTLRDSVTVPLLRAPATKQPSRLYARRVCAR